MQKSHMDLTPLFVPLAACERALMCDANGDLKRLGWRERRPSLGGPLMIDLPGVSPAPRPPVWSWQASPSGSASKAWVLYESGMGGGGGGRRDSTVKRHSSLG